VAALVFIALTIGLVLRPRENTEISQQPVPALEQPSPEVAVPKATVAPESFEEQAVVPKTIKPRRPRITRTREGEVQPTFAANTHKYGRDEIATEFLPLGYGNALSLQDGGQIVRVEVPRSTLVSFGLPVNLNRVGQRVKADLLLGVDGSARAIRFVQ
jgi:hypothetical protein